MSGGEGAVDKLAHRLRELRERHWPRTVKQSDLALALGASPALISSWENGKEVPPQRRLNDYADFFATSRSLEGMPHRVSTDEFSEDERRARDDLREELLELRETVVRHSRTEREAATRAIGGPWHFADGHQVTIVCAEVPQAQRAGATPQDPELVYGDLYTCADIDALIELYGHIRAANPTSTVRIMKASAVDADAYSTHLVLLGGADSNPITRRVLHKVDPPIRRAGKEPAEDWFTASEESERFKATVEDGRLTSDVGHFFRTSNNPYNRKRTLTICQGIFSLGTYAVVRALTDPRFRDRNADFLDERFGDAIAYSLLTRIDVEGNHALTPDWTEDSIRLHEWPD